MLDFYMISTRRTKSGVEIYPKFIMKESSDLMIRGKDFYAIWLEELGRWSTNKHDVIRLIDSELRAYTEKYKKEHSGVDVKTLYMWDADSGSVDRWHKYCQKQAYDDYHMLDEKLVFSNDEVRKEDYSSKRLNYPLEPGDHPAWDKLVGTLYSEEERHKIEWAIGAIVTGESKRLQKFLVLYGEGGTGKSTILNIVQKLFEGYYAVFDAKSLGSSSHQFALEAFKNNPLVGIQHDGDLSRIEDNTRLNSLISHEEMTVNEKYKGTYTNDFKCFLFLGTNRPVKITDAKSGLIRRLIDVTPTGNKLSAKEYSATVKKVNFELGAIAYHCKEVFMADPEYYNDYIPVKMLGASNDFYNYVLDSFYVFKKEDGTTLKAAWEMYKTFCDDAKVQYPLSRRNFQEELKNYFSDYNERVIIDGVRVRSYYSGFRTDKFLSQDDEEEVTQEEPKHPLIDFSHTESIFDLECAKCPAQYATDKGTPTTSWDKVTTRLSDLDASEIHFVRVPENHIVIDFDIPGEDGRKSYERNLEEASKWPPTYAELSKSGAGIHLHYIYTGDVSKLSRVYDDHIEIKVFNGKSSLRRRLTKCNNLPIAVISSGLPLKGEDKMVNFEGVKSEKVIRTQILKNLNKEYHPSTASSVSFIHKILEDAYNGGSCYDVTDMRNAVLAFAANSTNQADTCIKLVSKMHFKSEEPSLPMTAEDKKLIFYDVEVFPNLFLVNWKIQGEGKPVVRMINPKPAEIEELLRFNLVGFNCRRYDNHMLYGCLMGYTNEQLYKLSQRIIKGSKDAFFSEAYNVSYTDVYDFSSKKQSLKKWEIELGIHHQELGLSWDQPVPEELWTKVAEYCDNDVIATEAVFDHLKGDWQARQILVDLVKTMHNITDVTVNDTTNSLSAKLVFGKNRNPQNEFNYRDLSKPVGGDEYEDYRHRFGDDFVFRVFDDNGLPLYRDYIPGEKLPEGYSILPFFKDYKFDHGVSTFMGETIGEGGRVYAEPGIHIDVWDGDIASQHPHSMIFERVFGPVYTKRLEELVKARVAIKHKDFELAGMLMDGVLKPYLTEETAEALAYALKIVINSIYGLTSAAFANPFRDPRNKDNIVAKRGALFMTLLKSEVQKRGFTVGHIKTDSIKIAQATEDIINWITDFGKEYGYTFETEADFDRFCLVNDAVYVARYKKPEIDKKTGEEIWWTATGTQFQVPYVFKKLFSKKSIEFEDMCETKSVTSALYLDMNEGLPTDEHNYRFIGKVGQFCPIKPGKGGGELLREGKDKEGNVKYYSATGAKGYRWLESEMVKQLGKDADIDRSYYDKLVDGAVDTISKYGDFEWFVSDTEDFKRQYMTPPWKMACGRDSCLNCEHFHNDAFHADCALGHDNSDFIRMMGGIPVDDEPDYFRKR